MIKPKVVLDTNIYLSAIIFGGLPRKILKLCINNKIIIYVSPAILLEIAIVLKNKFSWSDERINKVVKSIANIVFIIKPRIKLNIVKKDSTDNKILEAAISSKANFIITGDRHLLEIKQFKNIKIVKPRKFLQV